MVAATVGEENGMLCLAVGLATRTAGILTRLVKRLKMPAVDLTLTCSKFHSLKMSVHTTDLSCMRNILLLLLLPSAHFICNSRL